MCSVFRHIGCIKYQQKFADIRAHTKVSEIQTKSSDFRHILSKNLSGNQTFCFDFRKCPKSELFGSPTVIECLKYVLVKISDTYCMDKNFKQILNAVFGHSTFL